MRKALVKVHDMPAGSLIENDTPSVNGYSFEYFEGYEGAPVSLTMPTKQRLYVFTEFPPFFDGVLPEGGQLEGLLKIRKIDRYDYFSQLVTVGHDLVGAVTVFEI
jgi:serine/threonine-protein kinase HipA